VYNGEMEKIYTVNETFSLLRISRAKLYKLIEDGSLKPIRLGGRTLFTESELTRFIEKLKDESKE
jgi:excisionase family DNA binding protein